jgi:hypothetical protein
MNSLFCFFDLNFKYRCNTLIERILFLHLGSSKLNYSDSSWIFLEALPFMAVSLYVNYFLSLEYCLLYALSYWFNLLRYYW